MSARSLRPVALAVAGASSILVSLFAAPPSGGDVSGHNYQTYGAGESRGQDGAGPVIDTFNVDGVTRFFGDNSFEWEATGSSLVLPGTWTAGSLYAKGRFEIAYEAVLELAHFGEDYTVTKARFSKCYSAGGSVFGGVYQEEWKPTSALGNAKFKAKAFVGGVALP